MTERLQPAGMEPFKWVRRGTLIYVFQKTTDKAAGAFDCRTDYDGAGRDGGCDDGGGGAVISAQYLGKSEPRNARKAAGQLVTVTLLLSLVIALAALVGNRWLLSFVFGSVETAVMDNAETYFWITALSYPFIGLYNACAALFRSMGNSKVSMMTSFVMNAVNIAGNAICVYGLKMGVAGVAWPTFVSRVLAAGIMFVLIQNRQNSIRLSSFKVLMPDGAMIKNILAIGIPNGLENGMFQFGKIFLQSLISSLGTAAIASYAVAGNLVTILYLPGTALGLGLITIVGQCVGAGRIKEAKDYAKGLTALNYRPPRPQGIPGCQVHYGCVYFFHVDLSYRFRLFICVCL